MLNFIEDTQLYTNTSIYNLREVGNLLLERRVVIYFLREKYI